MGSTFLIVGLKTFGLICVVVSEVLNSEKTASKVLDIIEIVWRLTKKNKS